MQVSWHAPTTITTVDGFWDTDCYLYNRSFDGDKVRFTVSGENGGMTPIVGIANLTLTPHPSLCDMADFAPQTESGYQGGGDLLNVANLPVVNGEKTVNVNITENLPLLYQGRSDLPPTPLCGLAPLGVSLQLDPVGPPACGTGFARMRPQEACTTANITFDLSINGTDEKRKVLAHKVRADDQYYNTIDQTADAMLQITGSAIGANGPFVNQPIYLKWTDPPDTGPTRIDANDARANDNLDADPTIGLATSNTRANITAKNAVLTVNTDATGKFRVYLHTSTHAAGDNYLIRASAERTFGCEANSTCPQTGVITVWKRQYLEKDRMFRHGSFVAVRALAGDHEVFVEDPTPFQAGQQVEFVHGVNADQKRQQPGQLTGVSGQYAAEVHYISSVTEDPVGSGKWALKFTDYGLRTELSPAVGIEQGLKFLADGAGVVTGNDAADFFAANDGLLKHFYEDMFIEVVTLQQSSQDTPYYPRFPSPAYLGIYAGKWCENAEGKLVNGVLNTLDQHNYANHRHVLGVDRIADPSDRPGVPPDFGANLGLTDHYFYSFVFVGRIEKQAGVIYRCSTTANGWCTSGYYGLDPWVANSEITTHEYTHQWQSNAKNQRADDHCQENSVKSGGYCLMHAPFNIASRNREHADGVMQLHLKKKPDGTYDSEYIDARITTDPIY